MLCNILRNRAIHNTGLTQQSVRMLRYTVANNQQERKNSVILERVRQELAADKKALQWRTPIGDRPEDWNSKLKLFDDPDQNSDFIVMMQQPIDISPKSITKWWQKRQENIERHMQQYVPERHEILGVDLAAAHFLLYRGAAVKFVGAKVWMRANDEGQFDLPNKFNPNYKVEALRCDNMQLYYEGLENLRCLYHLKFLSFHNVPHFDDWCLDRVSGSDYPVLEVLDISSTKCTARGLWCLYRIPTLKLLILDNPKQSVEMELTCEMLQQSLPKLQIVSAQVVHNA